MSIYIVLASGCILTSYRRCFSEKYIKSNFVLLYCLQYTYIVNYLPSVKIINVFGRRMAQYARVVVRSVFSTGERQ